MFRMQQIKRDRVIFRAALAMLAMSSAVYAGPLFDIPWYTIDSGGAILTSGGEFEISGTIGQPDAGEPMTGGEFTINGGFWPGAAASSAGVCGDFDLDGDVDLGDFAVFSQCFAGAFNPPAVTCPPGVDADCDDDGDVDLGDFAVFSQNFTGSL